MKILITGVHGFVGSNLVNALSAYNTIYGLDIVSPYKDGVQYTFTWDYLEQPNGIPDIDAIIHLAGKAHDTKNQSKAESYFQINTELTKKIYDYFLAHKSIKIFIFFSTAKAAADRVDGILTEDVVPAPVGPYGESKIAAEKYILANMPDDKQVYIFRPCMIHGPGNKGNLNLLYNVVRKGLPWPLGAFENRRTFTSVENVCFAVNGVLTKNVESGIYNMGDDEALSTNELIEIICNSLGKQAYIWKLPKGLMTMFASIGGVLHLPLNPDRLQKLTENYVSSNAKIKKALGVDKMPVRARDGLYKTIKSFERNR
jgi:nucleoside-diphosphate-sugar epimerase